MSDEHRFLGESDESASSDGESAVARRSLPGAEVLEPSPHPRPHDFIIAPLPAAEARAEQNQQPRPPSHSRPRRSKRRGIPVIITLVVLLIAAGVVGWLYVLPRFTQAKNPSDNPAPDLVTTPTLSDGVSILAEVEEAHLTYYSTFVEESGTSGVGLAYAQADYATFALTHDSTGYYEGYTGHYEDGLAAGTACVNSPEPTPRSRGNTQWYFWYYSRITYCMRFATELIGDQTRYDTQTGYKDGFDDGMAATPGAHQIPTPEFLSEGSFLQGFSLTDAQPVWTYPLEHTGLTAPRIKPIAYRETMSASQQPNTFVVDNGSGRIAFIVVGTDATDAVADVLVVLNTADGSIVAESKRKDADKALLAFQGEDIVVSGPSGTQATSTANPATLAWSSTDFVPVDYTGHASIMLDSTWVFVGTGYVNIDDGSAAAFGSDSSSEVSYIERAGEVFRYDSVSAELMKITLPSGENAWDQPVTTSTPTLVMDDSTVYAGSGETVGAYSLESGEEQWTTEGTSVLGRIGSYLVVSMPEGSRFIDVNSQESVHGAAATQSFAGNHMVYLLDGTAHTLAAVDLAHDVGELDGSPNWTLEMNEGQRVGVYSSTFVIWGDTGIVRILS